MNTDNRAAWFTHSRLTANSRIMNSFRRLIQFGFAPLGCLLILLGGAAVAQDQPLRSITYQLSMSRPASHLFEVVIEVELPPDSKAKSLDFQMPKWSPGRY